MASNFSPRRARISKVWWPYREVHDPNTGLYFLFKSPNPNPIKQSYAPILKESVSILLNELLKPQTVLGTLVPSLGRDANDTPDESIIKAAIASMDREVLQKVK